MASSAGSVSTKVTSKYIMILRIGVTAGLIAVAITFGTLSYVIGASFEHHSADERFHSIAHYGVDTLQNDFAEKENVILGMAKNMAYFRPNASEWPNTVMPGFYDSVTAQRDSANLEDIFFLPIVQPEAVSTFETYMGNYYVSESAIGPNYGIPGLGVFGVGPTGLFHDTTGEATDYFSPKWMIVPLAQELFTKYIGKSSLLLNMHSLKEFGPALDSIVDCSKQYNYSRAAQECVEITKLVNFPLFSSGSNVEQFRTAFLQPIYLDQNTSNLVGFMGGGFSWRAVLSKVLSDSLPGVVVVVRTIDQTLTFKKVHSWIRFEGFGDLHDRKYNHLKHSTRFFAASDGGESPSTYTVLIYPSNNFYENYYTNKPVYAAVASFVAICACAAVFFLYDYYVRGETAAHEAVLETKRRFVRFISHEIRTPLNAVHLGLEALVAELRRTLELLPGSPLQSGGDNYGAIARLQESLSSWLELSVEMTSNCDSAEDVLNDLLNYDKIEMGTLYLDFSSLLIWDVVKTNAAVFHNHIKQKGIHWSVENKLFAEDNDIEEQRENQFVVVGDSARLAQVMRNLVSNALKFTPNEGSISVRVERCTDGLLDVVPAVSPEFQHLLDQPRAGSVRISVTDSGAGLSEAQLAKICSEGVQFNANELQAGKGSGLGLFITKGIVEQHGGTLTVTSEGIGAGTTFAVELPLFLCNECAARTKHCVISSSTTSATHLSPPPPPPPAHADRELRIREDLVLPSADVGSVSLGFADVVPCTSTAASQAPLLPPAQPMQPKRILVVDDASSNRKMLSRILTTKGYSCEQAEDGQQAIDVYRASVEAGLPFYAITMDFEMPVMNGPTATGHLRALGCTVPIIGVTGNMLPDDVKHFKTQGASDVIGKPVSIAKFEELMKRFEEE